MPDHICLYSYIKHGCVCGAHRCPNDHQTHTYTLNARDASANARDQQQMKKKNIHQTSPQIGMEESGARGRVNREWFVAHRTVLMLFGYSKSTSMNLGAWFVRSSETEPREPTYLLCALCHILRMFFFHPLWIFMRCWSCAGPFWFLGKGAGLLSSSDDVQSGMLFGIPLAFYAKPRILSERVSMRCMFQHHKIVKLNRRNRRYMRGRFSSMPKMITISRRLEIIILDFLRNWNVPLQKTSSFDVSEIKTVVITSDGSKCTSHSFIHVPSMQTNIAAAE